MIKIQKARISQCEKLDGLVVVIDVIRAFTTAAYAFAQGAKEIILVGDVEEAFHIKKKRPDVLLMGEKEGEIIPGFNFGNSPVEVAKADLKGKVLVQRTSAGTQGVVKSINAKKMLVSSFVVAEATLLRILSLDTKEVAFVITGHFGIEDEALADYLDLKLSKKPIDADTFLERVRQSPEAQLHTSGKFPQFPAHDIDAVCDLDRFSFAMEVFFENGQKILRPISSKGEVLDFSSINRYFRSIDMASIV